SDAQLNAYRSAHRAHFDGGSPAASLAAWDRYLAEFPAGSFADDARFNRALCLIRLGRIAEARRALTPFADAPSGSYRQAEASAIRAPERTSRRRVPSDKIATPELVRSLADASRETKRQVGALVHRSGEVDYVIVGNASALMLPDIGRLRAAEGRFRALRLV